METTSNLIAGAKHNFLLYAGDDAPTVLRMTHPDTGPIDLTGVTVLLQIKKRASDPQALVQFTNGAGLVVGQGANNEILIPSWKTVPPGRWFYDVQLTFPNGRVATWLYGKVEAVQDTSR